MDLSQLPRSSRQRIHEVQQNARAVSMAQARLRQAEIAKHYRNHRPRAIEGIGGETLALDPFWWAYYLQEHNIAPGEDRELAQWLLKRRAEWCKVRHSGTRLQVGHASTPAWEPKITHVTRNGVKWRKTYADTPNPKQ